MGPRRDVPPLVRARTILFSLQDPQYRWTCVHLDVHPLVAPGDRCRFRRRGRQWELSIRRPDVLPMLVCHDGSAYVAQAELTRYLATQIHPGTVVPHRIALLDTPRRLDWYSADPHYLAVETGPVLDRLGAIFPTSAGNQVGYLEGHDLHSDVAWRHTLDPMLAVLLRQCWSRQG